MPLRELRELAKCLDAKMPLTAGVESAETGGHVRTRRYERELIQQILTYRQSPPSPWVAETVLPHVQPAITAITPEHPAPSRRGATRRYWAGAVP
jgi:hypothetical protein